MYAQTRRGVLDLVHTLSYKGMGVFPGISANEPTQLWIAARYLEACALFADPTFLKRRLPLGAVTALIGVVTGGALWRLVGHLLKLLSFYLIYLGVIHTGLTWPYSVLFSDLARATEELRVSNEDLIRQIAQRVETEDGLRSINGEMQGRLEDLNAQKRDLVLRFAESVMHKADNVQQTVRANRAIGDLQEENEILRMQLSEYLLMFEQAQSGIDTILAGCGNVEGGEGR